ncbi:junctional sarcoplasmic reticulum protein 1 isoform X2 [Phascolarctos cinereus]|uniref:Junctional sarcoplasmic reticulum protein 1 isoform X2 n=1 Tax=Phascolarctos cinereus TaxID=38626 RepID=A0A6P5M3V1_PHACI|nr:junctional sarcoplasmic reticulum protein 1 isoform X2 [Phascolarctos cinereus]
MATGDLEVLDRGLGCPEAMEELTKSVERSRKESQEEEEEAKGGERAESREETSSQVQVQGPAEEEQAPDGIGDGARKPSRVKAEKEHSADKGGSGKERGKTAAAPKSVPARKKMKAHSQPQVKPQPRTLGPPSDELPWGEITLNKCLALASVVAVLSMAFQVFQDVIDGEEEGPEAAPALWAWPGSSAPRDSRAKLPKPRDWAKASAPAPPPGPKPPVKETPRTAMVKEASPKEPGAEGQEAEGKASPAPAPEAAVLPEKPPWAALPKKEEKARNKKGFREDRAEPQWQQRKEGGHGPRLRREGKEEAPRRPWEREQEHRPPGRREDSKKARDGPRSKREEQRGRGGREGREDRDRFFPKQKHREGKRRD